MGPFSVVLSSLLLLSPWPQCSFILTAWSFFCLQEKVVDKSFMLKLKLSFLLKLKLKIIHNTQ